MNRPSQNEAIRVGGRVVEITRPEKLLFPGDRITKREFVEYYRRIAPVMLPHLRGRPIAMERYPDGIESPGFFQKKAPSYIPAGLKRPCSRKRVALFGTSFAAMRLPLCILPIRRSSRLTRG